MLHFFESSEPTPNKIEPFELPLHYLKQDIHPLPHNVATDLELDSTTLANSDCPPIYTYLFKPQHKYAEQTLRLWKSHFTSNKQYLTETQHILRNMPAYRKELALEPVNCDRLTEIWKSTKEDAQFLENYSYMDFGPLKFMNRMPTFLQLSSFLNMTSPILAFLIPIIFLLAPFVLLKMRGVPITLTVYLDVLSGLAKHHFIGKAVSMMRDFNPTNAVYLVMMIGFYAYQLYNNYTTCVRFYRKMRQINEDIIFLRNYIDYSIHSMQTFHTMARVCTTYSDFNRILLTHLQNLRELRSVLADVHPFEPSLSKIGEVGNLLRCYYEIHDNHAYGCAVHWSFGFEGYVNNLLGVSENLCEGRIAYAEYSDSAKFVAKDQYYPAHMYEKFVANDCSLDKNMVITGPNAAGKTTYLKTTMLNVIFSQQVGCGFYSECRIAPYTHIHSYLNIPDTSARDSLFQAESRRCKEILDSVDGPQQNQRHFCVFDELYSGTNPNEATKAAYAFLLYLAKRENTTFLLTTHYVSVCKKLRKSENIRNWKMDTNMVNGRLIYTYKIRRGISKIEGAICVLKEMGYPLEIIETIENNK